MLTAQNFAARDRMPPWPHSNNGRFALPLKLLSLIIVICGATLTIFNEIKSPYSSILQLGDKQLSTRCALHPLVISTAWLDIVTCAKLNTHT